MTSSRLNLLRNRPSQSRYVPWVPARVARRENWEIPKKMKVFIGKSSNSMGNSPYVHIFVHILVYHGRSWDMYIILSIYIYILYSFIYSIFTFIILFFLIPLFFTTVFYLDLACSNFTIRLKQCSIRRSSDNFVLSLNG